MMSAWGAQAGRSRSQASSARCRCASSSRLRKRVDLGASIGLDRPGRIAGQAIAPHGMAEDDPEQSQGIVGPARSSAAGPVEPSMHRVRRDPDEWYCPEGG